MANVVFKSWPDNKKTKKAPPENGRSDSWLSVKQVTVYTDSFLP